MIHPNTMRRVDSWLGQPLCFGVSVWYKFWRLLGLKKTKEPQNILFIELAEMGSTVIAHPSVMQIKKKYPKAKIHFLLFDHIRSSMDILDLVPKEQVFTIKANGVFSVVWDTLKFMVHARKANIDTSINLEMFARYSALLSYLSGANNRVGFHRFDQEGLYIGDFLTHKVLYNPHIHTSHAFLSLVNALDQPEQQKPMLKIPIVDEKFEVPKKKPSKKEQDDVVQILKSKNEKFSTEKRLILVNPNASKLISIRKWPLDHYAQLVKKLITDKNVFIGLTGVKSEQEDAQYIIDKVKDDRVMDLTGATTLPQLLTLFSLADLLITNDSGPAHFASLTNVHIMVFFGPETPKLYKPVTENCTVMYSNYYCSPCVSAYNQRLSPCDDNQCLKTISVDEAFETTQRILKK